MATRFVIDRRRGLWLGVCRGLVDWSGADVGLVRLALVALSAPRRRSSLALLPADDVIAPMTEARTIIERLALQPYPEGGWYRETWRADPGPTGGPAAPLSISCWIPASVRTGIASMRPKSGSGMPTRRYAC